MRKLSMFTVLIAALAFVSCKKCADCKCENTHTWEWDEESPYYSEDYKEQRESSEESWNDAIYEEDTKEYCERSKDLETKIENWEEDSYTYTDDGYDGEYEYTFEHDCTCSE